MRRKENMLNLKTKAMRRIVICALLALGGVISANETLTAEESVILQVRDVNPNGSLGGHPRTPVSAPSISQDGHTLYFNNVGYDLTLVLLDEDGDEVYTTEILAGTAEVELPATLNGAYELELYPGGSYYFYSEIIF